MFVSLLSTLRSEYSPDQQTIIGCPTQEQLAAILASVMHVQVGNIEDIIIVSLDSITFLIVYHSVCYC